MHKQSSDYLLFVIDEQTRAIASIVEATEYCVVGREVILVVVDVGPGTVIDGAVNTSPLPQRISTNINTSVYI